MSTGRWVHALALPTALLAVFLLPRRKGGPSRWAACGKGLALCAASSLAGIALPAVLGGLRVFLTGVGHASSCSLQEQKLLGLYIAVLWACPALLPAGIQNHCCQQ